MTWFRPVRRIVVDRSRQTTGARHGCWGFYYIEPGMGEITEQVFGILPPNGVGLSPDERTVYVAETPTARLWAYDLSERDQIGPAPTIYRGERGRPIAGLGGYNMFDSLAGGKRKRLRRHAGSRLHLGIRTRRPVGRTGRRGQSAGYQHRLRRPRIEDRLYYVIRQGQLVAVDWPVSASRSTF